MASTYLSRATSDPQSSNTTATYSVWVKKTKNGADACIWGGSYYSSDNTFNIKFLSGDNLQIVTVRGASVKADLRTNRLFRDVNAWYHIVVAVDTTQGTASDRIKLYINGVQETSFSTNTQPSQNENLYLDSGAGANYYIGQRGGNTQYFDGLMSHFHYVDGSQLAPTVFGSTDSTTGEWKINTSPSYTVGTKGFFVLKDGNSGTDQSANSNNFTVGGGTLTKTEDNPSNVFATLNPLVPDAGSVGYYHGNTQQNVDTSAWRSSWSTIGASSGKYYFESYIEGGSYIRIGARNVAEIGNKHADDYVDKTTNAYSYDKSGDVRKNDTVMTGGTTGVSYTTGDIIGCLLDLDNWTINWTKNGTLVNSTAYSITQNLTYVFGVSGHSTARIRTNFGNGYFQTTQVSSAGTNASGNGIFEFDCVSGFTALSTKGLNL